MNTHLLPEAYLQPTNDRRGRVSKSLVIGLASLIVLFASVWWISTRGSRTQFLFNEPAIFGEVSIGRSGSPLSAFASAEEREQIRAILAATPAEHVSISARSPLAVLTNWYKSRTMSMQQFTRPASHVLGIRMMNGQMASAAIWDDIGEGLVAVVDPSDGQSQSVYRIRLDQKPDGLVELLEQCLLRAEEAPSAPTDDGPVNASPEG